MKIGFISDLHLEFRRDSNEWDILLNSINSSGADLIINAGDTHPRPEARKFFTDQIVIPYAEILGNHDFYERQIVARSSFEINGHPSTTRQIEGAPHIFGCTLWTDFDRHDALTMFKFPHTLADGKQIVPMDNYTTLADNLYDIFNLDKDDINFKRPKVVVTHHSPSGQSVSPQFRDSGFVNYYFHSDLDEFILDRPEIKLFCHGHMHNFSDYMIGDCRVIANPLGYPNERIRIEDYKPLIVEI